MLGLGSIDEKLVIKTFLISWQIPPWHGYNYPLTWKDMQTTDGILNIETVEFNIPRLKIQWSLFYVINSWEHFANENYIVIGTYCPRWIP